MSTEPREYCPDSVSGHGLADRAGRCPYCGDRYELPVPRQTLGAAPQWWSDLCEAYRRTYDPDWGAVHGDTDPYGGRR